jgi:hypothetical protein
MEKGTEQKRRKQDLGGFVADEEGAEWGWRDANIERGSCVEQKSSRE